MQADESLLLYGSLLLVAGALSAFAGGLFGIGGGLLRVPIFLHLFAAFGVAPEVVMHLAAGTSLALAVPTGVRSALHQHKSGNLDAAFLRTWIPPMGLGVLIGLAAMRYLSSTTLTLIFGVAVFPIGLQMIALPPSFRIADRVPGQPVRGLMAAAIGGLATMMGISGGAFTTPLLTLHGYPIHRAVAVSAVGVATVSALATVGSIFNGWRVAGRPAWSLGYIDGVAVAVILPTILLVAPAGVKLANRLSASWLRRTFGVLLVAVGADMLWRVLGA